MENKNHRKNAKGGRKTSTERYIQLIIIGVLVLVIGFYAGKMFNGTSGISTGIGAVSAMDIIPTGVPAIYGSELGVSFDDVSTTNPSLADATIRKLKQYEGIKLSGNLMKRYVNIASSISCEYCCGAKALIFSNGKRACGCAHSFAMRGLAKYLLVNHPEMRDLEILTELSKWKVLFFPGILQKKAQILESQGIDSKNYINLASNKYRGIEKGQSNGSGMVGGC